ncbi:MAG: hypothetical protein KatS3mg068_1248 [Candidatus Sericytochromatia bacterium]|nr:MAG: hypothetical protein KatS3mg068_1248 [Candidatus Sericytochromatia bacterium]
MLILSTSLSLNLDSIGNGNLMYSLSNGDVQGLPSIDNYQLSGTAVTAYVDLSLTI